MTIVCPLFTSSTFIVVPLAGRLIVPPLVNVASTPEELIASIGD